MTETQGTALKQTAALEMGGEVTMRATVQHEYGEPSQVLRVATVPRPRPGDGEVLLRVRAAGVDRGVWHLTTGLPYPVRLAGYGLRRPKTPVRGREVAGVVEAVGAGVTSLRVGDEVFGIAEGCFAEYAVGRPDLLRPRPRSLTAVQAAALAISAQTALQAVRDHARVTAGQQVLVIGACGGVGSYAVQLAVAAGAEVTGMCSGSKTDLARSLGAAHVIDYTREELPTDHRFDAIIDTGGNRPLHVLRDALTPAGAAVLVGAETGGRWLGGTDRQLRALLLARFGGGPRFVPMLTHENGDDLAELARLADSGQLVPAVEVTFPLEHTVQALHHVVDGHARGKVVVVPDTTTTTTAAVGGL